MDFGVSRCTTKSWAKEKQAKKYNTRRDFRKAAANGGRLRKCAYWDDYHPRWCQNGETRIQIKCDKEINPIEEYLNIRNPNDNDIQSNLRNILNDTNPTMIKYSKCDDNRWGGSNSRGIWTIYYQDSPTTHSKVQKTYNINDEIFDDKNNDLNDNTHNKYFRIGPAIDEKDIKGGKGCTVIIKEQRKDTKFALKRDGGLWKEKDYYQYTNEYKQNATYIKKQWHNKRNVKDWDINQNDVTVQYDNTSDSIGEWNCSQCTYINFASSFCCMCMTAFDYNCENNQNNFHYKDEQLLPIQYKRKKNINMKNKNIRRVNVPISSKQSIIRETDSINDNDYFAEAVKYRPTIYNRNRKCKNKQTQQHETKIDAYMESFDIEISIIVTKYNDYKYIANQLFYNKTEGNYYVNVPMQLINTKLHHCSLKISHKNGHLQNVKKVYFEPMITDFYIPIYTTQYSFIFKHNEIPQILQNVKLFRMIKHCMKQCCIKNINFNHNISINSFNLYSVIFEYLPATDIISNVLFPFVGYSEAICIKTNVKNCQINMQNFFRQNNNEWNPIDDKYKSCLYSIKFKTIPNRNKKQTAVDQMQKKETRKSFSSDGQRNAEKMEVAKTANVLFKAPYRFCRHSNLLDDDDRDQQWWENVKYKSKIKPIRYQLNDKVKWGYSREYTISRVTMEGVWVTYCSKYGTGSETFIPKHELKSKLKLVCRSKVSRDKVKYNKCDRKRKAYSKASRNHFSLNRR